MENLVENDRAGLHEIEKLASISELAKIVKIKKALKGKNPDLILLELQKEGSLSKYFNYWAARSSEQEDDIKKTINDANKPIIEILIDLHILILGHGGSSKIVWKNPNIINPQPGKPQTIGNKQPSWKNQSEIADILGVTRQAIQKLCRKGGKFEPALNDKKKINRWHPIIVQHKADLDERNAAKGIIPQAGKVEKQAVKKTATHINTEVTFQEIEDLTVKEVVERYGGMIGFKNFVDALKSMSDWKAKETKYQEIRGKLVSINPVADSLFSILNTCLRWIVGEYPVSITDRLIAIAKSDRDTARIEIIELQEEELSKRIKETKEDVTRKLRDGGSVFDDSNVQQS